jgi:capsule polysaccharide export protein KpsC/LpsZ
METASVTKVACLAGIAPWKRTRIRQLLGDLNLPIARNAEDAVRIAQQRSGAIAAWATRIPGGLVELAAHVGVPIWRIEDGFIRSAGLGAALHDPSRPSDLEIMLSSRVFSQAECERADALIAALKALRVTKYNLHGTTVELPNDKRVALVIGQVADDASMQLGAVGQSIGDLIYHVRKAEPDAYLVYKPHPDVVAGMS